MGGLSKTMGLNMESRHVSRLADVELLKRIARYRDEDAFTCFFERHKVLAVNLALHITGDSNSADDAVQEAMLQIWQAAKTFQGEDFKPWFTCIVVREAIRVWRGRNRMEVKRKRAQQAADIESFLGTSNQLEKNLERKEALAYLKSALLTLPERQRVMLALHFGAGFTQREVGHELGVTQRAISKAIEKTLAELRGKLKASGLGAFVAIASEEASIGVAICTYHIPSGNLWGRVADSLRGEIHVDSAVGSSQISSTKQITVVKWLLGGLVCCALTLGLVWRLERVPVRAPSTFDANAFSVSDPVNSEDVANPVDSEKRLHRVWTFKNSSALAQNLFQGEWAEWRPDGKKSRRTGRLDRIPRILNFRS